MRKPILLSLIVLATMIGCASKLVLVPLPGQVPADFELSGKWALVSDSITVNRIPAVTGMDFGTRSRPAAIRDVPGSAAFVFLETGKELKITQTDAGLFIAFDRAIVEEYRFGELRLIAVGPIQAQRATGFPDDVLTIQTADAEGALMTETYRRQGRSLTRDIQIVQREKVLYVERRQYREIE